MRKLGIKISLVVILLIVVSYITIEKSDKTSITDIENVQSQAEENIIMEAFKTTDSNFHSFNINYNGKLSNEFNNIEKLRQTTQEIIESIGLIKLDYQELQEENMNQITTYGTDKNQRNITLILYSYIDIQDKNGETTMFLDINDNNNYEEIEGNIIKMSNVIKEHGIDAEEISCIVGTFDGELERDQVMSKMDEIINTTKSKRVESLVDKSVVSISCYTENIDKYIYSGENRVNLNIATRYNEYENKTYISIATPIIATGY